MIIYSAYVSLKYTCTSGREFLCNYIDKKRRYWNRGFHSEIIKQYFSTNNISDVGCINGEWDETESIIFVIKEPSYNIMMIPTFSNLTKQDDQKEGIRMVNGQVFKFKYTAFGADNYINRGEMENHNSLRNDDGTISQIILESAWVITWRPI